MQNGCRKPGSPQAEQRNKEQQSAQLLRSWHAALSPAVSSRYTSRALVLELISPLLQARGPQTGGRALQTGVGGAGRALLGRVAATARLKYKV